MIETAAYRKLMLTLHPDKHLSKPEDGLARDSTPLRRHARELRQVISIDEEYSRDESFFRKKDPTRKSWKV